MFSHPFGTTAGGTAPTQEGIMRSAHASFAEFVDQVVDQPYDDIILLTDQEATAAQRRCCKQRPTDGLNDDADLEAYALLLKDFLVYMRHGVATRALRSANCESLAKLLRS
jgi:hypothetical protein